LGGDGEWVVAALRGQDPGARESEVPVMLADKTVEAGPALGMIIGVPSRGATMPSVTAR